MKNNAVHQKILFVVNPVSGGKDKSGLIQEIKDFFQPGSFSLKFYTLRKEESPASLKTYLEIISPDKVVAVGGDGTVKMIAEAVSGTDIPIGIIRGGSANGMASELGIPADLNEALSIIADGEKRAIDTIRINKSELCIHLSDIGLNALLIKQFEKSGTRGWLSYAKALLSIFRKKRNMKATIHTGGKTCFRKAYMIVIANATQYGTGAVINPEGNLYDGKFEVVVVRKLPLFALLNMLITKRSFNPDNIEIIQATHLSLKITRPFPFQIDGEYLGKISKVEADIQKANVVILTAKPEA